MFLQEDCPPEPKRYSGMIEAHVPCSAILKPPFWAMEVLAAEHRPPPTIGLMRDTAGVIAACFAHSQTFGQERAEVDHRR